MAVSSTQRGGSAAETEGLADPADVQSWAIVPFAAPEGSAAAKLQALADDRLQTRRIVAFPGSSVGEVKVKQLPGVALGAYVWTAAVKLVEYVEGRFARKTAEGSQALDRLPLNGVRILEFGSGTGVTAIALAKLGAHVMATDMFPELISLAEQNIALNRVSQQCQAQEYAWGQLSTPFALDFNVILGSEITYSEGGFEPLLSTLRACVEGQARPPIMLLAETLRNPKQQQFWARAGEHFFVEEVASYPQTDVWNARDRLAPVRIFELRPRLQDQPFGPPTPPILPLQLQENLIEAAAVLHTAGACWLTLPLQPQHKELSLRQLAEQLLGNKRLEAFEEVTGSESAGVEALTAGDSRPDIIILTSVEPYAGLCATKLVDGFAVLASLAAAEATAWVPSALEAAGMEDTGATNHPVLLLRGGSGRRLLLQQHAKAARHDGSSMPPLDREFQNGLDTQAAAAPPLPELLAGQALVVDIGRMLFSPPLPLHLSASLRLGLAWTDNARKLPDRLKDGPSGCESHSSEAA